MVHVISFYLERKRHRTMKRERGSGTEGAICTVCMYVCYELLPEKEETQNQEKEKKEGKLRELYVCM